MEDFGDLLSKGFSVWKGNLTICLPFLLNIVLTMLILFAFFISIILMLLPQESLEALAFQDAQNVTLMQSQIEGLLSSLKAEQLAMGSLFFLGIVLLINLINSFFSAGAIGMAKQALETGKASSAIMWSSGREHFWNMFLAMLLTGVITLASLIFLLPAFAFYPSPLEAGSSGAGVMIIGILLFLFFALALSVVLITAPYALVVEDLGPIAAVRAAFLFFRYNKFDVAMLWLVVIALSMGLQMIGGAAGAGSSSQLLSFAASFANLMVLTPLSCIWWTRLYMNRKGILKVDEVNDPW